MDLHHTNGRCADELNYHDSPIFKGAMVKSHGMYIYIYMVYESMVITPSQEFQVTKLRRLRKQILVIRLYGYTVIRVLGINQYIMSHGILRIAMLRGKN